MSQEIQHPSDDQLILAIAQERSDAAFSKLFQRYKSSAYNLAYYLTHDRELAQEAIQEAMLGIWFNARNYSTGNAKGWILGTVSRKCFNLLRSRRRKNRFTEQLKTQTSASQLKTPIEKIETSEMTAAVREAIDALNATERQLVALYFGASLTQREISQELHIPQRTVSDRIKILLKKIKQKLAQQGLSGNFATVTASVIGAALQGNQEVPSDLFQHIRGKISQAPVGSPESGQQPQRLGAPIMITTFILALTILLGFWIHLNQSKTETPPPPRETPRSNESKLTSNEAITIDNAFEDDFDDLKLNPFWKAPLTPDQVKTGIGLKDSQMVLKAGHIENISGTGKGNRKVELLSQLISTNGKPFRFVVESGKPTASGTFTFGFSALNEKGVALFHQYYEGRLLPSGQFKIRRHAIINNVKKRIANPLFLSDHIPASDFDGDFKFPKPTAYKEALTETHPTIKYQKKGFQFKAPIMTMEKIQFKFSIQVNEGGWIRWPINKFTFTVSPPSIRPAPNARTKIKPSP